MGKTEARHVMVLVVDSLVQVVVVLFYRNFSDAEVLLDLVNLKGFLRLGLVRGKLQELLPSL